MRLKSREEQRRVERKSKRQDVESADEDAGEDESGSDDEEDGGGRKAAGSGSRVIDSDKAKKARRGRTPKEGAVFLSVSGLCSTTACPSPARPIAWKRRS